VKENKNLSFSDDPTSTIRDSDVIFICVNTPPKKDSDGTFGKEADMTYL
jgi:UDP-glucose 6-dehydrogenase